ncbi:hypothetical protein GCM10007424_25540 [Flavobacterium suaedae]|uniref:PEGA domain-containing protein n=1 Tax=Flavobacterium suaedae TaxID=1767027 RepID=A0ABQ1K452_9FLAO|nr:hypothetical protein [Flavobacterium suaedae]GGB84400.1 hypothetical protein GCM10007424_25540 [Flavobacterium suaedae]
MTATDFTIDQTNITVYNSNTGKETITVNGKTVSEKYSLFGTRHEFSLEEDNYEVLTSFVFWKTIGVKIQLRKNGQLIDEHVEGESTIHMVVGIFIMVLIMQLILWVF